MATPMPGPRRPSMVESPASTTLSPSKKRWGRIVGACCSGLILAGSAGSWALVDQLQSNVTTLDVSPGTLAQSDPLPDSFLAALTASPTGKPMNILLLGSDTRVGQGGGFGSSDTISGARSDTAMLVHLSGDRTSATVLSIPRDLWVSIPSCDKGNGSVTSSTEDRFNVAFEIGGPSCAVRTVTSVTGIPVDHVVVIDFKGFEKIVNTLDGLPVCLQSPINDEKAHLTLPAGEITLTGKQALGLARARYSLGDGSDLSRIVRQHRLVTAFTEHVSSQGLVTDPAKLYGVLSDTTSSVSADPGLSSLPAMAAVAWQVRNIPPKNVRYLTIPVVDRGDGATVAVDTKAAAPILKDILLDTYRPEPEITPPVSGSASPAPSASPTRQPKKCANPIN